MGKTAEEHNALVGPTLVVAVMDRLRECHAKGDVMTLGSVAKHIADAKAITGRERKRLKYRVQVVLDNMEASNTVKQKLEWIESEKSIRKVIELCPSSTN